MVEEIHSEWKAREEFVSALQEGKLVKLDPGPGIDATSGVRKLDLHQLPTNNQIDRFELRVSEQAMFNTLGVREFTLFQKGLSELPDEIGQLTNLT